MLDSTDAGRTRAAVSSRWHRSVVAAITVRRSQPSSADARAGVPAARVPCIAKPLVCAVAPSAREGSGAAGHRATFCGMLESGRLTPIWCEAPLSHREVRSDRTPGKPSQRRPVRANVEEMPGPIIIFKKNEIDKAALG